MAPSLEPAPSVAAIHLLPGPDRARAAAMPRRRASDASQQVDGRQPALPGTRFSRRVFGHFSVLGLLLRALPALLLLALALFFLPAAQAQWAWKDSDGRMNYSDAPPPKDINPQSIVRQPAGPVPPPGFNTPVADTPPAGDASPAAAPARAGPPSLKDQEEAFRKRHTEREQAEQKRAQQEAEASQRAQTCEQARSRVRMIDEGVRLMRPGPDGSAAYMDDAQRASDRAQSQELIAQNCGG
jgi:hypothetical protein